VRVLERSSKLAYSLPSSPSPGSEVLGGREGTSRGLGGGPFPYGLFKGEGANVSLFGFGETERSPRFGRGGTLGASSWAPGAGLTWLRAGRGGIEGGALMVCVGRVRFVVVEVAVGTWSVSDVLEPLDDPNAST
jgi:hypothetical protein